MAMTRRELLLLNVYLALAALGGRAGEPGAADLPAAPDESALADIAWQLFPHMRLSKDVYLQITEALREKISRSAALAAMRDEALDLTADGADAGWSALGQQEKVTALEQIQHTAFFQFILNECLSELYRHPRTWKLLGYEGSSLEFGGYINRGFNDIDWLPDEPE